MTFDPQETAGPVIRDKRRIDPVTGEVRVPRPAAAPDLTGYDGAGAHEAAVPPEPSQVETELAERTADLQRLQAEYVNYKRRVDRDREVVRDTAVATVLTALLPVLDDIGRAREHGEVTGGFKAVAESLERTVTGLGLVSFGEVGDAFDPHLHEALMHSYTDGVEGPVCQLILQVGYRLGDRVVRPARVAVAEPAEQPASGKAGSQQPAGQEPVGDEPAGQETSTEEPGGQETSSEEPVADTETAYRVEADARTEQRRDDEG